MKIRKLNCSISLKRTKTKKCIYGLDYTVCPSGLSYPSLEMRKSGEKWVFPVSVPGYAGEAELRSRGITSSLTNINLLLSTLQA